MSVGIFRNRIAVCQVVDSINAEKGGPSVSVTRLAAALQELHTTSSILTLDDPRFGPMLPAPRCTVHAFRLNSPLFQLLRFHPGAPHRLNKLASSELNLIHSHGLWLPLNRVARTAALGAGLPLVISPRGMLEQWSLSQGRWKKAVVHALSERWNLQAARAFHATSEQELHSIRQLELHQPVAVIPNGVDLPAPEEAKARTALRDRFPLLRRRKILLFLSRIHRKKGLDLLLGAWRTLAGGFPDWQLLIVGPDEEGLLPSLIARYLDPAQREQVTTTGPLFGADKEEAFAAASLFVLPSHSENFGNSVLEALSYGVPVITSTEMPWQETVNRGCGWRTAPTEQELVAVLQEALSSSEADRAEMGARGRAFAGEQFSWPRVGAKMEELYRWILEGGAPPSTVSL